MSGKRSAQEQLTDRNAYIDDNSDEENGPQVAREASADVLSRRKILKPRGFKSSNTPKFSSPLVAAPAATNGTSKVDTNSKLKALNSKFVESLTTAHSNDPTADLRPIVNKYLTFYDQIFTTSTNAAGSTSAETQQPAAAAAAAIPAKPAFGFAAPSSTSTTTNTAFAFLNADKKEEPVKTNAFAFLNSAPEVPEKKAEKVTETVEASSSESDSDDDIKVEGPKFTLAKPPTTKNSVFTFGAKPKPEISDDSDSEDDIKVEGPKFTLPTNPSGDKSFFGGFKLQESTSGFKFQIPPTSSEKEQETSAKPAFSFTAPSAEKKDEPKPAFSFTPAVAEKKDESKPAFSFSAPEKKEESKPAFSFGAPAAAEKKDEAKPAFSFSAPEKKDEPKPAFSFGAPAAAEKKDEAKPAFSFSAPADPKPTSDAAKPVFGFNSALSNDQATKPAFSFGSSVAAEKSDEAPKPAFSFGSTASGFSFGGDSSKAAATDNSKPAFSFGSAAEKPSSLTPFTFGASTADPEKPKPSFSSSFNFGGSSSFNFTPATASNGNGTANAANGDDEKVEDHEPTTDFKPVVTLDQKADLKTGEEDEEVKYTKRSKLLLLQEGKYVSKGLGELKILYNGTTQKTRILIRADGSLRVLLNAAVRADFKYEKLGKGNMVKFPTVDAQGDLQTFVIQVKASTDGDDLLKALDEGKS